MKESAARTRILAVASRLFYEQGYNSTGINQIIDEAEIARGSLYNHFPSKRDLLTAYIERAEDLWFADLDKFLLAIKKPKKKLLALFDFRMERQLLSNFGGCQFNKIGAELQKEDLMAFDLIKHQKERLKTYITQLIVDIDRTKQQGLNDEMLGNTLFLLIEGATVTAGVYKDSKAIKEARKIAESLI